MDRLLTELRAGRLCRIVVWRLDRLGRTTRGLCQLFEELQEKKVDLVSLKDGFSLASPAGRLHARILASVAEYETEIRAERVHAGQQVARRKGKTWGGSRERLAVAGHRRAGDGDPGDEGGEDTDRQDRQDHRAVSPDDLPGTESFDSGGRVTLTTMQRIDL